LAVNTQLNASNIDYHSISKYHSADYICIHEGELRHDYRNRTDSVENLVTDLSEKIKADIITITRGKAGSLAYKNNDFFYCPAFATNIVDRVGAGDTLLAITSLCFAAGVPADLTLFIGNLAAAQMVATTGTGMKLNKVNLIKYIESMLK
jgi:bifunctional ADP-heptose synthase (sugar kinase/adenylyltransferase)